MQKPTFENNNNENYPIFIPFVNDAEVTILNFSFTLMTMPKLSVISQNLSIICFSDIKKRSVKPDCASQ